MKNTDTEHLLYEVPAGCVLGAGNGNNNVADTAGRIDSSHIIVNGDAHIYDSVYGGGNYGVVGDKVSSTNGTNLVTIDVYDGTIDKDIYGGANSNNVYGTNVINIMGGDTKGTIYGGCNTKGT